MRSANHLAVKAYCRSVIPTLMQKHGLGEINTVTMDSEGWVNPCFFVNNQYVFRFNARDPHLPKYQREKFVFDLLKETEIPVPQEVILDTDKDVCQYDVLISKMVAGINLESSWKELGLEKKEILARRAGENLRRIHNIEFPFFGETANQGPLPQTKSWYEFLDAKLEFLISEAMDLELFDQVSKKTFRNALFSMKHELSNIQSSRLVHVDYHFGNLLFDQDQITAVLDFEWAIAGDPLYDLTFWRKGNETYPQSEKLFFEGYGKEGFLPNDLKLMEIYQMMKNVELTIVAKLHFTREESSSYLKTTLEHVNNL